MPIKAKKLEKRLLKKGFEQFNGGTHKTFVYVSEGKKTDIKMSMSHDGKEIGDTLASYIRTELKLESKKMLEDLVDCNLSKEGLYTYYKDNSFI